MPWVGVVPVVCLLAGCFSKPGEFTGGSIDAPRDGDVSIDAPTDAPLRSCGDIPFSGLHSVQGLAGVSIVEPTITDDLREVYFTTQPGGMFAIGYATRTSSTMPFVVMGTVPFEAANAIPPDPSVSADGNLLVYRARKGGIDGVYLVTRVSGVWGTPELLTGFATDNVTSLEISGDGLTLYFESGQLRVARRATRTAPFVPDPLSLGANFRYPTVTADGLEMFYNDGTNGSAIKRTTRQSEQSGFLAGAQVFTGLDPDLTGDGQTLVFTQSGTGLSMVERVCPTP